MVTKRTDYTAEAVEAARSVMLELTRLLAACQRERYRCNYAPFWPGNWAESAHNTPLKAQIWSRNGLKDFSPTAC